MLTRFLEIDSLKALGAAIIKTASMASSVFWFQVLLDVCIQNRDRFTLFYPLIDDWIKDVQSSDFVLLDSIVSGLSRVAIRFIHNVCAV